MPTYNAKLILTDIAGNGTKTLTGELSDDEPPVDPPGGPNGGNIITANLAETPTGPMPTANKDICWGVPNDPLIEKIVDDDPAGEFHSVVATDKGRAIQLKFPKGSYGVGPNWPSCPTRHMVYLVPPKAPVTLEWDFMFKDGFDYSMKGKLGPQISWGEPSGERGGIAVCFWWTGGGDPVRGFQLIAQNQRRGSTLSSEFIVAYAPKKGEPPIEIGQWNHLKLEVMGGAGGYSRYYLEGQLMGAVEDGAHPEHPWSALTTINDSVQIPVCGWFGGDASYAAKNDSYFLMSNITITIGA